MNIIKQFFSWEQYFGDAQIDPSLSVSGQQNETVYKHSNTDFGVYVYDACFMDIHSDKSTVQLENDIIYLLKEQHSTIVQL